MSWTPNVGCREASYWSYSASVIKRSLETAIQNNGIVDTVPKGVLSDARKFFKITLKQTTGNPIDDHITVRLHNAVLAWRWLGHAHSKTTKEEFKEYMQKFLFLLERLSHSESITLDSDEQITAGKLIVFYRELISEWRVRFFKTPCA